MQRSPRKLAFRRLIAMILAAICGILIWEVCKDFSAYQIKVGASVFGGGFFWYWFDRLAELS